MIVKDEEKDKASFPPSVLAALRITLLGYVTLAACSGARCQIASDPPGQLGSSQGSIEILESQPQNEVEIQRNNSELPTSLNSDRSGRRGLIVRSLERGLQDQKQLYLAPFKPANIKWDVILLAGTAALLATDRQSSRALPTSHLDASRNISNISLDTTSAVLVGIWAYGIKTKNKHAKETGELALETLANTFLIYTPMQFAAGRERPEEGTGNGRFWRHGAFNTSFPAGHPMFTWTMASVVAHEYPRTWVKVLAYGAASSVSVGRFLGREHFASDILVGSVLGYLIGAHIFHAHCNPELSDACHR